MGRGPQGEVSLEAVVARLTERVHELEQEVGALRNAQATASTATGAERRTKRQGVPRTSRRRLLQLGGAAAAATVGAGVLLTERSGTAVAAPQHFALAPYEGDATGSGNWGLKGAGTSGADGVIGTSDSAVGVEGQSNSSIGVAGFSTSGHGVSGTSSSGDGVVGNSTSGPGVVGSSSGNSGVLGNSTTGFGVYGLSTSGEGVFGASTSSTGVNGFSSSGIGGAFQGGLAPLYLSPGGAPGAPTSGSHFAGEVYLDSTAVVWVCVAGNGTSVGTWVRLPNVANGTSGGALTYLSTPIRLLDTRVGQTAHQHPNAPIASATTFALQAAGFTYAGQTIPSGATALFGNILVAVPPAPGNLIFYPNGSPVPLSSNIGFNPNTYTGNFTTAAIGTSNQINILNQSTGPTDVIFDCFAYVL